MPNLSLNEIKKIERMNNLSLNELNPIAIARNIKNYKDMLREDLLIALLKSNQSHTELLKIDDSTTEIGETKKLFNSLRNNFSREEIKKQDLNKIKKYEYSITHDIRNLFNEITKENYYELIEIKSALDGNYIEYKSRGDNNDNLSLE